MVPRLVTYRIRISINTSPLSRFSDHRPNLLRLFRNRMTLGQTGRSTMMQFRLRFRSRISSYSRQRCRRLSRLVEQLRRKRDARSPRGLIILRDVISNSAKRVFVAKLPTKPQGRKASVSFFPLPLSFDHTRRRAGDKRER